MSVTIVLSCVMSHAGARCRPETKAYSSHCYKPSSTTLLTLDRHAKSLRLTTAEPISLAFYTTQKIVFYQLSKLSSNDLRYWRCAKCTLHCLCFWQTLSVSCAEAATLKPGRWLNKTRQTGFQKPQHSALDDLYISLCLPLFAIVCPHEETNTSYTSFDSRTCILLVPLPEKGDKW